MKFLPSVTIIVGKSVICGRKHYGVTYADIHLEAKQLNSVTICGTYNHVCDYQIQTLLIVIEKPFFL